MSYKVQSYRIAAICFRRYASDEAPDYYRILGVSRNATTAEIKKAYYKLSKIHHPDRNLNESDVKTFQQISEAYKTLGFSEKKRIYDVEHFLPHISEDDSKSIDHEFAKEMLELNEKVDGIEDESQLVHELNVIKQQISENVVKMEDAFAQNDVQQSRCYLNRLRYILRIKALIHKKLGVPD